MVDDAQIDRYRWLQRMLEMVPGLISWAIILGPIWLSFSYPWLVAYFVLTFDFYMLCRSLWLGVTVVIGYRRMRRVLATDWKTRLETVEAPGPGAPKARDLIQLALIPTYTEPLDKLRHTVQALAEAEWPTDRKICAIITRESDAEGIANVKTLRKEFRG